jgi:hypothetical protein
MLMIGQRPEEQRQDLVPDDCEFRRGVGGVLIDSRATTADS